MMTQEELDALMNAEDSSLEHIDTQSSDDLTQHTPEDKDNGGMQIDPANFRVHATKQWPPPPPDKDHKVVHQLDDVTRDTEVKANEVFDQLDIISSNAETILKAAKKISAHFEAQSALFTKLTECFPHVSSFKSALESIKAMQEENATIKEQASNSSDAIMQAMDIMQFQDINRQRIERVINVMRALSQYMNSLFESKIDDSKRVDSAVYISGDENPNIADDEEIENLIASFGKKK